jgi:hypothetical protein
MKHLLILSVLPLLFACTDADMKQITTLGNPAEIVCYSGTLKIYEGKSSGKISTESGSDGWFFEDRDSHKLIRVSGACVITN